MSAKEKPGGADARTARLLATIALAAALLALVLAGYAVSLEQERSEELRSLSEAVRRAIERGSAEGGGRPPPPFDTEE